MVSVSVHRFEIKVSSVSKGALSQSLYFNKLKAIKHTDELRTLI